MSDQLQRFLIVDSSARAAHVKLNQSVQTIMQQHDYPPVIQHRLTECLLSSVLLTHMMKVSGELTLQLHSSASIKMLVAKCNQALDIRGLAQWDEQASEAQLAEDFSSGELVITLVSDHHTKPFQSIVALSGGTISTSLSHYFEQSEQLETSIVLNVNEQHAAALLLQRLPQAEHHAADWQSLQQRVAELDPALLGLETSQLIALLFRDHDVELFPAQPVQFKCRCSVARMQQAIKVMGQAEAEQILADRQVIAVTCEYCNEAYRFSPDEVAALF